MEDGVKLQVQHFPESPGVYQFFNAEDTLIYVGKAKNLKKRVSSYFTKSSGLSRKTLRLVSEIRRIEYVISGTEFDALLLENTLIKQNQPKYNILLKDGKTFPYLCIMNEPFPRIISTRKYIAEQGEFFGPYAGVTAMKNILELVRKLYTIRTCSLALTKQNIKQKKFKVCLEYHIGNCKGPCEGLQSEEEYLKDISQIRTIFKGQVSIVKKYFEEQMKKASADMQFEKAHIFKEKLNLVEGFQSKSLVVNPSFTDIDVITITSGKEYAYVNYLTVKEGAVLFSKSLELKKKLEESDEELISYALLELRTQSRSTNAEVLSNLPIGLLPAGTENNIPKIGDKKKLVLLSLKNTLELQREKELARSEKKEKKPEVLSILQKDLQLQALPSVIECFDNSNFQGTTPVASMVRFVDGKPDKNGYRHFNIKTVTGPNDFASMKEIVHRRYYRLLQETHLLPDLILVDGGKGQLSSACEALKELGIYGRVPIAGIAKKLEEIYYPEDPLPLHINKKSPSLRLLQFIRDEAHRFAITFHRQKRSKAFIKTEMDEFKGIGKQTIEKLLSHFKSMKKIKAASFEEIERVVGKQKAMLIKSEK
ncbi:MAG: excinuclease ABC subunit UvrC [Cyclobacteriaceae bacterium]